MREITVGGQANKKGEIKRMKKKIAITILTAIVSLVSLVGCGKNLACEKCGENTAKKIRFFDTDITICEDCFYKMSSFMPAIKLVDYDDL